MKGLSGIRSLAAVGTAAILLTFAVPGAQARDRGVNQPGAAGNRGVDAGVNQPGRAWETTESEDQPHRLAAYTIPD